VPQSTLTFITESLPDFHRGVPANFQIEVSGGTPPYIFEVTQGTLPRALTLSKKGKITGVPRRVADTTVFVKVTDKVQASLTQAFAVRVEAP
jgi:Putative Ig domain